MLVLLIDTAVATGGVLLARYDLSSLQPEMEVLGTRVLEPRQFSTQLMPALADLLKTSGFELPNLDVLAVVSGPGSFTGLRIGLSAVKALAEVAAKPVIAVSRLAMMAAASSADEVEDAAIHAFMDAGRGEFYHGIFRDRGMMRLEESLHTLPDVKESIRRYPGRLVACEDVVFEALSTLGDIVPLHLPDVTVQDALPLVLATWRKRKFSDVAKLDANYLRRIEVPNTRQAAKPIERP